MKTIQSLKISTILYLLIPSVLFLLTWIHLWIGIPCVLFIVFYTWKIFQDGAFSDTETAISTQNILLCLGISIALNFLLGIGEFRYQTYDFQANNFKYYDLITHDLPVYYAKQQTYLCYYTGYYLPSALLAKVFGIESCRYFSFIWSVLGLWIVMLWISTFINKNQWILLIIVILFANIWVMLKVLSHFEFFQDYIHDSYIQLNHFKLITETLVKNYAWATQHTLPACLGACMMIDVFRNKTSDNDLKIMLLMLFSTMFWSPLTTIGLFPFVAFCFLKNIKSLFNSSNWHNLRLMVLLILSFSPLLLYFISTEGIHNNNTEFIWQTGVSIWWIFYLIYIFSNFVGWGLFLKYHQTPYPTLWKIAVIFPCLIAFYRIGIYNDFNIRVSFPSFFILSILVGISVIEKMNWKSVGGVCVGLIILLNSLSNINQLQKGIFYQKLLTTIEKPFIFKATNMLEFQRVAYEDESAILEYSLKKDSVFEKYFLKK
jgi:hypothetical protein